MFFNTIFPKRGKILRAVPKFKIFKKRNFFSFQNFRLLSKFMPNSTRQDSLECVDNVSLRIFAAFVPCDTGRQAIRREGIRGLLKGRFSCKTNTNATFPSFGGAACTVGQDGFAVAPEPYVHKKSGKHCECFPLWVWRR